MINQVDTTVRSFEEYSDEARALLDQQDENRWRIGAIVNEVQSHYGDGGVEKLCEQAKGKPSTMYEYAQVERFYPKDIWQDYPLVRWSQWRRAMKLEDVDKAMALIARANDEDMRIVDFEKLVKDMLGENSAVRKIFDAIVTISRHKGKVHFDCPVDLTDGQEYRVVMYEA